MNDNTWDNFEYLRRFLTDGRQKTLKQWSHHPIAARYGVSDKLDTVEVRHSVLERDDHFKNVPSNYPGKEKEVRKTIAWMLAERTWHLTMK
jgi:hypothetical protein